MKLYHGGYNRIEHPDCLAGRDNLDFGKGFYTTLIREHAELWARQVSFNRGQKKPILNVYEFDKGNALKEYRYRFFPAYDEDWMDFIVSSRPIPRVRINISLMAGLPARFTSFRLPILSDSDIHGRRFYSNLRQRGLHRIHTCFPFNP